MAISCGLANEYSNANFLQFSERQTKIVQIAAPVLLARVALQS
jgi:hypothetical protein